MLIWGGSVSEHNVGQKCSFSILKFHFFLRLLWIFAVRSHITSLRASTWKTAAQNQIPYSER